MLKKFRIEERKSHKFHFIQIHHEQFDCGCRIRFFRGELFVDIAYVFPAFLEIKKKN